MLTKKFFLGVLFLGSSILVAQIEDSPKDINLIKKDDKKVIPFIFNPKSISTSPIEQSNNYLKIPEKNWDLTKEKRPHRGQDFVNQLNNRDSDLPVSAFRKNQNLGAVTVNSNTINIICRDHQYVDGDIVEVSINGKVFGRLVLDSSRRGFEVSLKKGFNKIDFKAINVGSSYPNTAELIIKDKQRGHTLSQSQWMLDKGFMASIVVIKE